MLEPLFRLQKLSGNDILVNRRIHRLLQAAGCQQSVV